MLSPPRGPGFTDWHVAWHRKRLNALQEDLRLGALAYHLPVLTLVPPGPRPTSLRRPLDTPVPGLAVHEGDCPVFPSTSIASGAEEVLDIHQLN